MPYTELDDNYGEAPKNWALSHIAFRLQTCAIIYCNRHHTDGVLLKAKASTLIPGFRQSAVTELVKSGHWVDTGESYTIHDFLEHNASRAEVDELRAHRSAAGRKGAQRRWQKR